MELKRDLTKKKSNRVLIIIFSVTQIIFAGYFLFRAISSSDLFYWISVFVFLGLGLINLFETINFPGKNAFVSIDSKEIAIRAFKEHEEERINWDNVESIEYKLNKYYFTKKDNNVQVIDLSSVGFALVGEIKETVNYHAKKKNIEIK